jgi:hypothetical protein
VKRLTAAFSRAWRARFHHYVIDDPRPIAESAPYTYFLPSENELLAVQPGDIVKLTFRGVPLSPEWGAERMWVQITHASGNELQGVLDNVPCDMPQLRLGDAVAFHRSDIIDVEWAEERDQLPPAAPPRREYWDRCLVDACVLDEGVLVHYLYREVPDLGEEGDRYPDSGWRIRGDYRDADDEAVSARDAEYIALGKVLNADDNWLHLIDAPIGSAFLRNWETGAFEPTTLD